MSVARPHMPASEDAALRRRLRSPTEPERHPIMITAPIAVLALLALTVIFSGLIVINMIIGSYAMALGCLGVLCVLGVALGLFVGKLGTELDGVSDRDRLPSRLDLSASVLRGLREVPEGVDANASVPPLPGISMRHGHEVPAFDAPVYVMATPEGSKDAHDAPDEEAMPPLPEDDAKALEEAFGQDDGRSVDEDVETDIEKDVETDDAPGDEQDGKKGDEATSVADAEETEGTEE